MTTPPLDSVEKAKAESEKHNANQWPVKYYARHMQPGLCGYNDEKVLVDTDALKRMLGNEAIGKPVYVLHNSAPNEERLKKLSEEADGYITDSFYNELDGWGWFGFLATTDRAHQAIAKGWKVSNAYIPSEWGPGGTKNNIPHDREIVNGAFTHLAIVPDPRYEEADIMTVEKFKTYQDTKRRQLQELQNSKSTSGKGLTSMFNTLKLFKRTPVETIDADTLVEKNGQIMTADEFLNGKMKKNESDEDKEKMNADSMIDCGEGYGDVPLGELINGFKAMKKNEADEKKNAEDKAKKDEDDKKAKEKENADKDDEEKKNARFEELRNAHNRQATPTVTISETSTAKVERGKQRYGSGA